MHSLTTTVRILSNVVGGVTNLTVAKIIDIFGRPHGLFLCVCFGTLGLDGGRPLSCLVCLFHLSPYRFSAC
jgi:hypothetical protein